MMMSGGVTVTVRLVRSFQHRNFRPVVYQDVSVDRTVQDFVDFVRGDVAQRDTLPPPFKRHSYDTMKIIHQAHGSKSNDLVVSLEDDEKLILRSGQTLREAGVAHETELAFFCYADYSQYKSNPVSAW
ncbi:UPF0538 protein C2orf76 homolog isoform X2 [Bufo gargarizans]|uniref:UPF0538 protein C2orf76 homolog isoform X2 n=1 Tax=Bufo gargarizans TaxID=30331 RepID=UPI001CF129E6|nr:UPF0538 protein C2orf76 homolog isoform X2 [Bufo gargarizans]